VIPFRTTALLSLLVLSITSSGERIQGTPPRAEVGPIRHVILVSVDGLVPATYVSLDEHGLEIPTLREIVRNGVWSSGARSVFPSVTYPAHTSIATGTNPGRHGIFTNLAWDPWEENDRGWRWYTEDIRVPTLWDAARERGLRVALVSWPVTVGAHADAVVPEVWRAGTAEDPKLTRALSTPGILEAVQKRFPNFAAGFMPPGIKDEALTDIAVHLIETRRPHLLLLHIFEVDSRQHEEGIFSDPAKAAIENADRQIARLIAAAKSAGIWESTALVVVSDHGFAPVSHRVRPGVLLREKGLVTLDERNRITDWKAVVLESSGTAYLYCNSPDEAETRQALRDLFLPLVEKPGSGIGHLYTPEEIRAKGGDTTACLALEAVPGFRFRGGYTGDYLSSPGSVAAHGFDPDRPEMQASLLVYGPAIRPAKIEGARLIDVAPTIAQWLRLKLEDTDGEALQIPLRHSSRGLGTPGFRGLSKPQNLSKMDKNTKSTMVFFIPSH